MIAASVRLKRFSRGAVDDLISHRIDIAYFREDGI
jgi:hypothetical protein